MLKLGHISYSNCVPVHGRFLEHGPPASVALVQGVPGQLNRRLALGEIDVAPASSIEYARHSDAYRILPGLSISARRSVQTIRLLARKPIDELADGTRIALPTASATSVALLKIIMRQRFGIRADYGWFEQELQDPLAADAEAALYLFQYLGGSSYMAGGSPAYAYLVFPCWCESEVGVEGCDSVYLAL